MAGANAVFKAALGRTKAGSNFGGGRSTHRSSMSDGSGTLVNTNQPNMHLATAGPGSAAPMPTGKAEARTFRGYAPQK
jgi:hypothetical protein